MVDCSPPDSPLSISAVIYGHSELLISENKKFKNNIFILKYISNSQLTSCNLWGFRISRFKHFKMKIQLVTWHIFGRRLSADDK